MLENREKAPLKFHQKQAVIRCTKKRDMIYENTYDDGDSKQMHIVKSGCYVHAYVLVNTYNSEVYTE